MLEAMTDLPPNIHGLKARGRIMETDHDTLVQPLVESARKEGRPLRLLYELGPEYQGTSLGALMREVRMGLEQSDAVQRCAVVSDLPGVRIATALISGMVSCPLRSFELRDEQVAIDWVANGSPPAVGAESADVVQQAGLESFPASDAPSFTPEA
jgi:hypothetical protein